MFNSNDSKKNIPKPLKVLFFLALATVFIYGIGSIIQFLWNYTLVEVTDVKPLSFWQAIALFVLSRILFGGFRFGHKPEWRKKKAQWRKKWMNMSDEEREQFKQRWKERCKTRKSGD